MPSIELNARQKINKNVDLPKYFSFQVKDSISGMQIFQNDHFAISFIIMNKKLAFCGENRNFQKFLMMELF